MTALLLGAQAAVGILGGTFDPVHYGHLRLAIEVREALGLAEVRLLPAAHSNLRNPPRATPAQRVAMLSAALGEGLALDAREVDRGGVSYTIDTLAAIRAELPHRSLCFILGADSWQSLPRWHRWRELLDYAHLVIATRPGSAFTPIAELASALTDDMQKLHANTAGHVLLCPIPLLPISSTDIRARIAAARDLTGLLPDSVIAFINRSGLYREP